MFGSNLQLVIVVAAVAALGAKGLSQFAESHRGANKPVVQTAVAAPSPVPVKSVAPAPPQRSTYGEEHLAPDANNQFHSFVEINGTRIPVMVDTGATLVSLSYEDAMAVGVAPPPSEFIYVSQTANGAARVAKVKLKKVQLGFLAVNDVDALVSERGAMSAGSLLGMSYLSKLHVEMSPGGLILRY